MDAAASAGDPFSVSGDPHALMGGAPPESRPTGDLEAWHRKLCTSTSGILYEDTYLQVLFFGALWHALHSPCRESADEQHVTAAQVGVKMQFQGPHGQLMLFLGNKAEAPLQRIICAVPPSQQFAFQQGPVPAGLDPKKQIQVPLNVTCLAPFLAAPRIDLGYTFSGQPVSRSLPLPLTAAKFCMPPSTSVPREAFFQRWRALDGERAAILLSCASDRCKACPDAQDYPRRAAAEGERARDAHHAGGQGAAGRAAGQRQPGHPARPGP